MVAETLDLPVVLVIDAKAGMESVAATALGFATYAERAGRDIEVAGILAQRAHGGRHERGIREALPEELTYFGRIPPDEELVVPDRHLGLHMGEESPLDRGALQEAVTHIETDRLLSIAREPVDAPPGTEPSRSDTCVAVARDQAFSFVYPATLERLEAGSRVEPFSPVAGDPVPDCDGIYLPGGYPERFASELAASETLRAIRSRAEAGTPIYGECGGLIALARSLETTDGESYRMAGVLPADIRMTARYQALDHVALRARSRTVTANAGETRRGHEFHYSEASVDRDATLAFAMERGDGLQNGRDGLTAYRTLGTYAHVHPESGAFDTFLERVRAD
jgi:cobyrinic acid a,c-diamide synthase